MRWHINCLTDQCQIKRITESYNGKVSVSFYARLYEGSDNFMRGTDTMNASLVNSDVSFFLFLFFCQLAGIV